jgi:hypothetical protein
MWGLMSKASSIFKESSVIEYLFFLSWGYSFLESRINLVIRIVIIRNPNSRNSSVLLLEMTFRRSSELIRREIADNMVFAVSQL